MRTLQAILAGLLVGAIACWSGARDSMALAATPTLTPPAHEVRPAAGEFRLSGPVAIVADDGLEFESGELRALLINAGANPTDGPAGGRITLRRTAKAGTAPNRPESYQLLITPSAVEISAGDAAGIHYGVLTLSQWIQHDDKGAFWSSATIRDWPDQGWRSAYLNWRFVRPGSDSIEKLKALIRGFSAMKLNILVIEVSDNLKYDFVTFPDRATPAFTKENLGELVRYARQRHVEMVPYLQTISHVAWLRSNAALYEKLKEADIVGVWNSQYCPSNPQAVQLVHDMIEAQIAIFQPKYFHIGLDEVSDGPFATCPICSKKDSVALYRDAVLTLCNQLRSHQIRPIIYGDAFTHRNPESDKKPPFGWEIIDQIPKEVLIDDWDYSNILGERYIGQLKWFSDKGFDLIGSSYQRPANVASMPLVIQNNPRGKGIMLTYWNDVESWENYQTTTPAAWATTVISAMRGWKVQPADLDEISQDLVGQIASAIEPPISLRGMVIFPVDLSNQVNGKFGTSDKGFANRAMSSALAELSDDGIALSSNQNGDNAIVLSGSQGDGLFAGPVTIPINRTAAALRFIQTCDRPFHYDRWNKLPEHMTKKPVIGQYQVRYADGSSAVIELKYNWNITDWNSPYGTFDGRIAYQGHTDDGARLVLLAQTWPNPSPDKVILDVVFRTAQQDGMSPVLLAMDVASPDHSPVMIDSFDGAAGKPDDRWRIAGENFSGPVASKIVQTADPDHRDVLEVSLPKSAPIGAARLILDTPVKYPPGATQLSFWIHLSDPTAVSQSGIYLGNDLFAKNGSQFQVVKQTEGWQQVLVSLQPMQAAIKPQEVSQLRISLWVGPNQPANIIQLDHVRWIFDAERNNKARARWYE